MHGIDENKITIKGTEYMLGKLLGAYDTYVLYSGVELKSDLGE